MIDIILGSIFGVVLAIAIIIIAGIDNMFAIALLSCACSGFGGMFGKLVGE